jgi:hypothetical protein
MAETASGAGAAASTTIRETPVLAGASEVKHISIDSRSSKKKKEIDVLVYRDTLYHTDLEEAEKRNFVVESDIWILDDKLEGAKRIVSNLKYFITNDYFEDEKEIEEWLTVRGKFHNSIAIRKTPTKGYGTFATKKLRKEQFLGYYEGRYRDNAYQVGDSSYCFSISKDKCIDAINLTFSNWTRFINDGKVKNTEYRQSETGAPIEVWTIAEINEGEELIVSYSAAYWDVMKTKGVEFKD